MGWMALACRHAQLKAHALHRGSSSLKSTVFRPVRMPHSPCVVENAVCRSELAASLTGLSYAVPANDNLSAIKCKQVNLVVIHPVQGRNVIHRPCAIVLL